MELRAVCPNTPLGKGTFGIMQPDTAAFHDYSTIDLALIPGMAFDHDGHRLGRGRAYYDRMLHGVAFSKVYKIGVCFPYQLLPYVPSERSDVNMDEVITSD